ncbi:hypothetical protein FNV43_RR17117 [Rhamnella rubrinervis]|uniref:Uncharacterized protein n=1 Tax=Rhamnella rubrinervis TaxID=2594499 RepID=A0A8K0DWI0_9ROSA|nr:hypothetical protein FNV43_RR17117 [Rhamnella rubrinervis]
MGLSKVVAATFASAAETVFTDSKARNSFQWGGTIFALLLLILNRLGQRSSMQTTLLVLYLFASFPNVLFEILSILYVMAIWRENILAFLLPKAKFSSALKDYTVVALAQKLTERGYALHNEGLSHQRVGHMVFFVFVLVRWLRFSVFIAYAIRERRAELWGSL